MTEQKLAWLDRIPQCSVCGKLVDHEGRFHLWYERDGRNRCVPCKRAESGLAPLEAR